MKNGAAIRNQGLSDSRALSFLTAINYCPEMLVTVYMEVLAEKGLVGKREV